MFTHSAVKPYICDICGRDFSRKPHYNEHMRGHRGDYPYNCSKCKKGFFRPKLLREHRCIEGNETVVPQRAFKPRRVKRKPGRPRKILKRTNKYPDVKEINVLNPGNLKENQPVIDKVVKGNEEVEVKENNATMENKTNDNDIANSQSAETNGMEEDNSNDADIGSEVETVNKDSEEKTVNNAENVVYINTVSEVKKLKTSKPECYVKTPPASLAVPLSMVDRYITVQLTTTNAADGAEIQAQFIATGDLGQQIQFPIQSALHPIQIIEAQPITLAVSQGDQLGDVNVEQNVIDIPVDIVSIPSDQALVCSQEEVNTADSEVTGQVYEIEDYGTADTVLQGSENLIDSSVEIIGPENM